MKKALSIIAVVALTLSFMSVATFTASAERTVIYKFTFENGGDTILRDAEGNNPCGEIVEYGAPGNHALKYDLNTATHELSGKGVHPYIYPLGIDRIIGAQGAFEPGGETYELTIDIACVGGSENSYMYPFMLCNGIGAENYFDNYRLTPTDTFQTHTWTMSVMLGGTPKQGERNGLISFFDDRTLSNDCTIYIDNVTLVKNGFWKEIPSSSAIYYIDGTPAEEGIVKSESITPDAINYEYELINDNSEIRITKYLSNKYEVIIPSIINGKPVTEIGDGAFNGRPINSVTIPETVVSIGSGAFSYCSYLSTINFLGDITSIGPRAFNSCSRLTNINTPDSVISVGKDAFDGTNWFRLQPNGMVYIGKVAYKYKGDYPESLVIKDGIVSISDYAFSKCVTLTDVTIPNSVTNIGDYAFNECTALKNVTLSNSVRHIGNHVFAECSSLTNISIPTGVTSIGDYTFYWCSALTSISIPNGVTSIGECAFCECSSLLDITIPDSITSIGNSAFSWCNRLSTVYYGGTRAERTAIQIDVGNNKLLDATWVCKDGILPEESFEPSEESSSTEVSDETVLGDANGDSSVDMKDVLIMRKFIAGMNALLNQATADVDGDGQVTMKDVLLIRKFIAGLISSYNEPIIEPVESIEPTEPIEPIESVEPAQPPRPLVLVADDQYASIWYSGCEKENASETNVYFVVQNKTNYQLTVEVDSLAVNGWTLTDVFVFEPVAPNSKANIKVATKQLNSLDVTSISGVFALWDTTYNLWDDSTREYTINKTIN